MNTRSLFVTGSHIAAVLAFFWTGGCDRPESTRTSVQHLQVSTKGATMLAFGLVRRVRSASEVADRATRIASTLLGQEIAAEEAQTSTALASVASGSLAFAFRNHSPVKVMYREDDDDLAVINEDVTRDTRATTDVGLAMAEHTSAAAFNQLVSRGVINSAGWDRADILKSQIKQGVAAYGEAPTVKIKEYLFTYPRKINGVGVFNAGVTISVHRSGAVARVRVFGPTVISTARIDGTEQPSALGGEVSASVDQKSADKRVAAEFPTATVESKGVQYFLPEGQAKEKTVRLEPTHLYLITPTFSATANGMQVRGKGFYVSYSLTDAAVAPVRWPPLTAATPSTSK